MPAVPGTGMPSVAGLSGVLDTWRLVNAIHLPSGDQSASSDAKRTPGGGANDGRPFVRFTGGLPSSSKLSVKMSLSTVGPPGSPRAGVNGPWPALIRLPYGSGMRDAERWNAMYLLVGSNEAELPRVRGLGCRGRLEVPSYFM